MPAFSVGHAFRCFFHSRAKFCVSEIEPLCSVPPGSLSGGRRGKPVLCTRVVFTACHFILQHHLKVDRGVNFESFSCIS